MRRSLRSAAHRLQKATFHVHEFQRILARRARESDGFEETVDRLADAIKAAGLLVIARLDHAGGAHTAGLELPPTLVLVYGHPKGGTPIMQAHPTAALDLPLRVLVRQDADGRTLVAFHPVADLLAPHGVPAEIAQRLTPAQDLIRRALGA